MKNAIIVSRVSTSKQENERQVQELTKYCDKQEWEVVNVFEEVISGTTPNLKRPVIQEIIELAKAEEIDIACFHEISRIGRSSFQILEVLEIFTKHRVDIFIYDMKLHTLNEDGTKNPFSELLFNILSAISTLERNITVERVKSGLKEARRKGVKLGRPNNSTISTDDFLKKHNNVVKYLKRRKNSIREIATLCSVSPSTVQKVKKMIQL